MMRCQHLQDLLVLMITLLLMITKKIPVQLNTESILFINFFCISFVFRTIGTMLCSLIA